MPSLSEITEACEKVGITVEQFHKLNALLAIPETAVLSEDFKVGEVVALRAADGSWIYSDITEFVDDGTVRLTEIDGRRKPKDLRHLSAYELGGNPLAYRTCGLATALSAQAHEATCGPAKQAETAVLSEEQVRREVELATRVGGINFTMLATALNALLAKPAQESKESQ